MYNLDISNKIGTLIKHVKRSNKRENKEKHEMHKFKLILFFTFDFDLKNIN